MGSQSPGKQSECGRDFGDVDQVAGLPQTGLEKELDNADGVILFDGHCAFCRNVVGLLLQVCRERKLFVCSVRSARGASAAVAIGSEPADTFAFVTVAGVDVGVGAYVKILSLGSRTAWLGWIIARVPRVISISVYEWIAGHRPLMSSLWGNRRHCPIPADRYVPGGV